MADNPFDQFDDAPAQSAVNPFDQFDLNDAPPRAPFGRAAPRNIATGSDQDDPIAGARKLIGDIGDWFGQTGEQSFEALGAGEAQAIREGGQTASALNRERIAPIEPGQMEYERPFEWLDLIQPGKALPKMAYGLGRSAPSIAGGIAGGIAASAPLGGPETPWGAAAALAGGGIGAGGVTFAQSIGPFYAEEIQKTPDDPDGAFERAGVRAQDEGAISAAAWAAFGIPVFKEPIKQLLFQAFVGQPGTIAAGRELANVREGRPLTEGVMEQIPGTIAMTAVPALGHEGIKALGARPRIQESPEAGTADRSQPGPEEPPPTDSGPAPQPQGPNPFDAMEAPTRRTPAERIGLGTPGVLNQGDGTARAPIKVQSEADLALARERITEPTEGQKEAGNYPKGHIDYGGFDVAIETPKGGRRSGTDPNGRPWSVEMPVDYGYIKGTRGNDGEHIDVYLGPRPEAGQVYVIDQVSPETGRFDEHKAMLGFDNPFDAIEAYHGAFSDGRAQERIGAVTSMTTAQFREWANRDGVRRKPVGQLPPRKTLSAKPRVMRLGDWLRRQGGLQDPGGELAAMNAGRLINERGMRLEDAALMAQEEGYLPQQRDAEGYADKADLINALLDALGEDLGGTPRYSRQDEAVREERRTRERIRRERADFPGDKRWAGGREVYQGEGVPFRAAGPEVRRQAARPEQDARQTEMPGTERISDRELAERRMRGGKGTDKTQKDTGDLPLFDTDGQRQKPLLQAGGEERSLVGEGGRPFYSELARAVRTIDAKRAPGSQWLATLKNRPGVKATEIEDTGLGQWLEENRDRSLSREEVLQHVEDGAVRLEETVLTNADSLDQRDLDQASGREAHAWSDLQLAQGRANVGGFAVLDEAYRRGGAEEVERRWPGLTEPYRRYIEAQTEFESISSEFEGGSRGGTKFDEYTLPGGTNYREMLLKLPSKDGLPPGFEVIEKDDGWGIRFPDGHEVGGWRTRDAAIRSQMNQVGNPQFTSSHWDQPNVLAHTRLSDRVDADGKRVLHVEEIQSDWHQKGRRGGYQTPEAVRAWREAEEAVDALRGPVLEMLKANDNLGFDSAAQARRAIANDPPTSWEFNSPEDLALAQRYHDAVQRHVPKGEVPDAPFKKTWHELMLKRIIRYAAEHGYDRIAWTPGYLQAARYDLSKHIDKITYYPQEGVLHGFKDDAGVLTRHNVKPDDLPGLIGKEAADKLLNKPTHKEETINWGDRHELSGVDLKVGGEGMRGFYDKIVPDFLNKYGKKFGAKVGRWWTEGSAHQKPYELHSIDVTPEMREAAMRGQPLFQKGGTESEVLPPVKEFARFGEESYSQRPLTKAEQARHGKLIAALNDVLKQIAPHAKPFAFGELFYHRNRRTVQSVHGLAMNHLILYALEGASKDHSPLVTIRHEALHTLKTAGLFTDAEWRALERGVKDRDLIRKLKEDGFDIERWYERAPDAAKTEEAIAEIFGRGRPDLFRGYPEYMRGPLMKLHRFFVRLGAAIRKVFGRQPSFNEVMDLIERGDIGARGADPTPRELGEVDRQAAGGELKPEHRAHLDRIKEADLDEQKVREAVAAMRADASITKADAVAMARESGMRTTSTTGKEHALRMIESAPFQRIRDAATAERIRRGAQAAGEERDIGQRELYAVHNLSASKLLHADKMGGLAVPSVAIIKGEHGFDQFGEISLIGPKDLVDPKAGAKVFGADAYSPRYPSVRYKLNRKAYDKAWKDLEPASRAIGDRASTELDPDTLSKDGLKAFEDSTTVRLAYAREKGIPVEIPMTEGYRSGDPPRPDHVAVRASLRDLGNDPAFQSWVQERFAPVIESEHIFKGFNYNGRPILRPHTLENVVKEMRKTTRDGEGFNYGVGSIRSKVTPQFRSIKAMKNEAGRIVDRPSFEALKKEVDQEFLDLAEQMRGYSQSFSGGRDAFRYLDAFSEHLKEIADRKNVRRVLDEYYDGFGDEQVQAVGDFMRKLRDLPTQYFEAKLPRAVGLSEFKAAAVPFGTPDHVLDVLRRAGISDIRFYDRGDPLSRQMAINKADDALRFQKAGEERDFHPVGLDAIRRQTAGPEVPDDPRQVPPSMRQRAINMIPEKARAIGMAVYEDLQMWATPMAAGTPATRATAKDFANAMRLARWHAAEVIKNYSKVFSRHEMTRMWLAADDQSVGMQKGDLPEGAGLATLTPKERAGVEALQRDANQAWTAARDVGLVEGDGLPSYVPRILSEITQAGSTKIKTSGGSGVPGALDMFGTNLKTTSPHLRQRKYLTTEETEKAARTKFDGNARVIRDIRTLVLATLSLREAVAGRALVNDIKEIGRQTGEDTVVEGYEPSDGNRWFTIDHPSLKTWKPRLKFNDETKSYDIVRDENGDIVFDRVPIFIRGDFEGPLRSILSKRPGKFYSALMDLKGRAMTAIMYSPLIHNAVEWGRALPAMPGKVATFRIYTEGNAARRGLKYTGMLPHMLGRHANGAKDLTLMHQAIQDGMAPIGHGGQWNDITGEITMPDLKPGRSWTSQIVGAVPGLFDRIAGTGSRDAVLRGVDKLGDLWHNTLLWDRVADLQMGLYVNLREKMIKKGFDPVTAGRTAAHLANRYAGALPLESMSDQARKIANVVMFSRSFTLGNIGAIKDMFNGLPRDVAAQIERDAGVQNLKRIRSYARRKAIGIIAVDIALMYAANSILQSALSVLSGRKDPDEEAQGYVDRLNAEVHRVKESPMELLNPFGVLEGLTANSENEPGRENRIFVGFDADGTAIYARNPAGKLGEEFEGWITNPLDMITKKLSTAVRPLHEIIDNDRGFGRKVYDPYAETVPGWVENIGKIVWHFMEAQVPGPSIEAAYEIASDPGANTSEWFKVFGPLAGVTFSRGAPGGPAVGEMYRLSDKQQIKLQAVLPHARERIQEGNIAEARRMLEEIGVPPRLIAYYIRTTLNPSLRLSGKKLREFNEQASPEEKERMQRYLREQP